MDAHKPKPMHSWRELLGEIGVVVLGVLIALGAEQIAEQLHWLMTFTPLAWPSEAKWDNRVAA